MAAYSLVDSILLDDADLQGLWTLDDVLTDYSGNGNILTASGSPTFGAGKFNNGIDLELSSSQYLYINDNPSLSITGDISISAWVNAESLSANHTVASKYYFDSNRRAYMLQVNSAGKLFFAYSPDGTTTNFYSTLSNSNITAGTFFHIAVTADVSASDVKLYINGSASGITHPDDAGTHTSIQDNNIPFRIGANDNGGNLFDGIIDDVAVFSRVLTPTEIGQIYDGTLKRKSSFFLMF